jgi:hypothetical protein
VECTFEPAIKHNYHPGYTLIFPAMIVSLTVGKVDAGMAVLLTEDKRIVRQETSNSPADGFGRLTPGVSAYRLSSRPSSCRRTSRSAPSSTSP